MNVIYGVKYSNRAYGTSRRNLKTKIGEETECYFVNEGESWTRNINGIQSVGFGCLLERCS
jgi:hypothetical protein